MAWDSQEEFFVKITCGDLSVARLGSDATGLMLGAGPHAFVWNLYRNSFRPQTSRRSLARISNPHPAIRLPCFPCPSTAGLVGYENRT